MSIHVTLEVGKEYKCGDRVVKVVHIEGTVSNGGMMTNQSMFSKVAFAQVISGGDDLNFSSPVGVFDADGGMPSSGNRDILKHHLEEIVAAKEMTMEQVNKALGYEVKIVEE